MEPRPVREIRAFYDAHTIRVYQAYAPEIAETALRAQTFVDPFKRARMTWIKPSFNWMMYRSGWASKPGQERVLAIDIQREGFEWALSRACLAHFEPGTHASPEAWRQQLEQSCARVQWDPERDVALNELPWRSLQLGLSGAAVSAYVERWIARIQDVTALARQMGQLVQAGDLAGARSLAPLEAPYVLTRSTAERVGA